MAHQSSSSEWDRYDKKQKEYECPCGKSYYSYPALYTHIKSVHNGNAPGQIRRPDVSLRGRPRLAGLSRLQQHTRSIQPFLKADPIPKFVNFINKMQNTSNKKVRDLYCDEPVFKLIKKFQQKLINPKLVKEDSIFQIKMGEGLIVFFNQLEDKIQNPNNFDQVVLLITLLTQYIIDETQDQTVLSQGTIGLMPEFVNYFIIHDLENHIKRLKIEDLWICQRQNTLAVLDMFFKWMLFKKYTLTKVTINNKYGKQNEDQEYQQNQEESMRDKQYEIQGGKRLRQDEEDAGNILKIYGDGSEQGEQFVENIEQNQNNLRESNVNNNKQSKYSQKQENHKEEHKSEQKNQQKLQKKGSIELK